MALRHNITDNPQMLGLAKSKVAQLRSTMAKKTKHLSQIIKTKDGLMKLRIAGENEYAYLLKNKRKTQWLLVAYCNHDSFPLIGVAPQWALFNNGDSRIVTVHPERITAFAVTEFNWVEPDIPNITGFILNYEKFFRFEYEDPSEPTIFAGRALLDHPDQRPFQYAHVAIDYGLPGLRKIFINTAFFKKIELRPTPI